MTTELDLLRKTLRTTGPGHNLDKLRELGFGPGVRAILLDLAQRGEATRVGAFWWLRVKEPKSYPKQPQPPPAQPLKVALGKAGIQEEKGHAVRRTPRRKAS